MSYHDLQKSLQAFSSVLYNIIGESVGEDFTRKGRNCHTGGLSFEDVSEVFEVGVASADGGGLKLERSQ